ncbi:ATPase domain-containing protein [Evansella cellulosilytica]|uniref:Putative circadian clock protein, KaiC n=1 Tax=Evansella cellulosilytica (strain ATCC 21833 / DSM 2522 / FERM P-1141 / JCM 9156 / N-4) TaxID=649639 RepID=E6U2A8_EVAC2|nr:ATPase domain-containing protein [Evansella cellulosilytica]ADU30486.1 putative circadian clock protein, KaiC [Evansella cellulosilytica DSM 2522]
MYTYTTSGIEGLDYILNGGFPTGSSILLEGAPGTGKTILGMQFLYDGALNNNESGIYITFEEFPDQIYNDMDSFGWDIKSLEKENKLRVICISPDVLLEQMKKSNGIFDQVIKEINCKRIVIDSLSLFSFGMENQKEARDNIYTIRNILRKHRLSSILIHEQTNKSEEEIPFVSYVLDGVIRLSLQGHHTIYRKRTLEVLKMRGCCIKEGEHIYRINNAGIDLIPSLSMVEDKAITLHEDTTISTGVPALDRLLLGGIQKGTSLILDTNSKANYKYFIGSIISKRALAGENIVILLSSLMTILDMEHLYRLFGVDIEALAKQKKIYFIEHYDRPIPDAYKSSVIKVHNFDNEQYNKAIIETLTPVVEKSLERDERWFIYYDLNTVVSQRGRDFVKKHFPAEVAKTSSSGITLLALCNFTEIGSETASFLERTCNGVLQTWVDGNYQYFQVRKSPQGIMSQPLLVQNIQSKPFIRLI